MIEIADIFQRFGESYRQSYRLPPRFLKAMSAIERCRTAELGGHLYQCDNCGHQKIAYNSCSNRHCPKCQSIAKEKWIIARKKDLLPVGYFHVVFTLPNMLNSLALMNQKEIYSILFKAASETLLELGKDPKYLGAEIGFITILHTWGQNLKDHPHLHCIVPGGGLSLDGNRWIYTKKKFFVPVKVLSRLFRGKFMAFLKEFCKDNKLKFEGKNNYLAKQECFQSFLNELYTKEWVTYCKPPFKGPEQVIEYLARYTHRVAISNNRIIKLKNQEVTFRWRDYSDNNKNKLMTLDVFEFIRRFLLHILPDNFVKIRHYGILSNRSKKTRLKKCQEILKVANKMQLIEAISWEEIILEKTGIDPRLCPCCGGRMKMKETLHPKSYVPPEKQIYVA